MATSELEYHKDPTLQLTRTYDKINPDIEGFEEVIRDRRILTLNYRELLERSIPTVELES